MSRCGSASHRTCARPFRDDRRHADLHRFAFRWRCQGDSHRRHLRESSRVADFLRVQGQAQTGGVPVPRFGWHRPRRRCGATDEASVWPNLHADDDRRHLAPLHRLGLCRHRTRIQRNGGLERQPRTPSVPKAFLAGQDDAPRMSDTLEVRIVPVLGPPGGRDDTMPGYRDAGTVLPRVLDREHSGSTIIMSDLKGRHRRQISGRSRSRHP